MTAAPATHAARGLGKSPAAFRTIAEVATELTIPPHVLRFWESKFPQLRPLKRRGGRRYYRPEDVALLRHIRSLLYAEGYTIKGVQRLLREGGRGAGHAEAAPAELNDDSPVEARASAPADLSTRSPRAEVPAQVTESAEPAGASGRPGSVFVDRAVLEAILLELQALRDALRGR